jgi:hypothetical protein
MRKIILITMLVAMTVFSLSVSAAPICGDEFCDPDSGETCTTCSIDCGACPPTGGCTGSFLVQDFTPDIACKFLFWTGSFLPIENGDIESIQNGIFDPFHCIHANEALAAGLLGELPEDDFFQLLESVQERLLSIVSQAQSFSGIDYLTEQQIEILEAIANGFGDKLIKFKQKCTPQFVPRFNGDGEFEVDAATYVICKQLLADMIKELGQASYIVWFTPEAVWMVQVLEDIQNNLENILAQFDEGAVGAFDCAGGGEAECTTNSDCNVCETCSGGTCVQVSDNLQEPEGRCFFDDTSVSPSVVEFVCCSGECCSGACEEGFCTGPFSVTGSSVAAVPESNIPVITGLAILAVLVAALLLMLRRIKTP